MKRTWKWALILGLAAVMSACSSSPPSSETGDEIPPTTDETAEAGTDVVPPAEAPNPEQAQAEQPPSDVPPAEQKAEATPEATPSPTPSEAPAPEANAQPEQKPEGESVASDSTPPLQAPVAAAAAAGSGDYESYTTASGDTLMKIAFETYGDLYQWKKIYEDNKDKISNPNSVPKGVVLKIEKPANPVTISRNGEKYLIKRGDTLGTISNDVYGTRKKWKQIWENNKELIRDPNKIYAGFYLYYTLSPEERQNRQLAPQPLAQDDKSATTPRVPAAAADSANPNVGADNAPLPPQPGTN